MNFSGESQTATVSFKAGSDDCQPSVISSISSNKLLVGALSLALITSNSSAHPADQISSDSENQHLSDTTRPRLSVQLNKGIQNIERVEATYPGEVLRVFKDRFGREKVEVAVEVGNKIKIIQRDITLTKGQFVMGMCVEVDLVKKLNNRMIKIRPQMNGQINDADLDFLRS